MRDTYRAWDKINKVMLYDSPGEIPYCADENYLRITNHGVMCFDAPDMGYYGGGEWSFKVGDYETMKCSGLSDVNGTPIYEGDIVVMDRYIWFDDGKPNYRGTVEWIYSQWQVIAHCVNPEKQGISNGVNEGLNDDGFEDGENSDWKVIGNIHQHPHLLIKE